MPVTDSNFAERVSGLVGQIPRGRVMTYGHIAAMCGSPRAARVVGGVAHFGNPRLPWQRVVKKDGSLAEGYPGGTAAHRQHLLQEGVVFLPNGRVNMQEMQWLPGLAGSKVQGIYDK